MNDARVFLRPVGNPLPLAFFALAAYAGLAMTLADARHGSGPLPVGRGESGRPVESAPTDRLDCEPGVRRLL